ncbi:MAG: antibiotic biosynthesis monooxygenase family protein [Steroidobacteraceae bacterium]
MILVIVQHFVKPGMVDTAECRVSAMGKRMAPMPGFLFRHALVSSSDANKLVTVTAWSSREYYEGWLNRQRTDAIGEAAAPVGQSPYVRVETEVLSERVPVVPGVASGGF